MSASKLRAALNRLREAVMPKEAKGLVLHTGPAWKYAPYRIHGSPDDIVSVWGPNDPGWAPHRLEDPRWDPDPDEPPTGGDDRPEGRP